MNATTKRAQRKTTSVTDKDKAFAATLSPKLRSLYLKTIPLRGKFTKALAIK